MSYAFDINAESEELVYLRNKLKTINDNLIGSVETMQNGIQRSADFLSGNQFEKAQLINNECTIAAIKTGENIQKAMDYLNRLEEILDEYSTCKYEGN